MKTHGSQGQLEVCIPFITLPCFNMENREIRTFPYFDMLRPYRQFDWGLCVSRKDSFQDGIEKSEKFPCILHCFRKRNCFSVVCKISVYCPYSFIFPLPLLLAQGLSSVYASKEPQMGEEQLRFEEFIKIIVRIIKVLLWRLRASWCAFKLLKN